MWVSGAKALSVPLICASPEMLSELAVPGPEAGWPHRAPWPPAHPMTLPELVGEGWLSLPARRQVQSDPATISEALPREQQQ